MNRCYLCVSAHWRGLLPRGACWSVQSSYCELPSLLAQENVSRISKAKYQPPVIAEGPRGPIGDALGSALLVQQVMLLLVVQLLHPKEPALP